VVYSLKGEYDTIREAGGEIVAVSADWSPMGGLRRAVFVIDQSGKLLHRITWSEPGNIGQFWKFQALEDQGSNAVLKRW